MALCKDKEPSRTGWTKLLCFKMTSYGSRLFSIKTQGQRTRFGGVKKMDLDVGKHQSPAKSEVQVCVLEEKKPTH